jgi:hypothetical protein
LIMIIMVIILRIIRIVVVVVVTIAERASTGRCRMKPPPPAAYGADGCVEGAPYHNIT